MHRSLLLQNSIFQIVWTTHEIFKSMKYLIFTSFKVLWSNLHLNIINYAYHVSYFFQPRFPDIANPHAFFIPRHTIVAGYYGFTLDIRVSVHLVWDCWWANFIRFWRELSALDTPIFSFPDDNLRKCQGILTKFGTCIDMKEIWCGIANGQISPMFDRVICQWHDNGGVLYFNIFLFSQFCRPSRYFFQIQWPLSLVSNC